MSAPKQVRVQSSGGTRHHVTIDGKNISNVITRFGVVASGGDPAVVQLTLFIDDLDVTGTPVIDPVHVPVLEAAGWASPDALLYYGDALREALGRESGSLEECVADVLKMREALLEQGWGGFE